MHKRYHAQRQHIIHSFDALLYQLHTLSFILSPSIWSFVCRLVSQVQCSKPRDLDATASRSLRFFYFNILFFNAPSIWHHATQGPAEGRAVVLDFVGLDVPSKLQLLGLDVLIIFLQMVLTTIAYEASLFENSTELDTQDMLLPIPPNSPLSSPTLPSEPSSGSTSRPSTPLATVISEHTKAYISNNSISSYVVDLRVAPILARLRNPPPPPRTATSDTSLPLPNTTPWPLPNGMRMLMRSTRMRGEDGGGPSEGGGRIPGGLAERDG